MNNYNELLDWLRKEYSLTERREVFYDSQHNTRCGELRAIQRVIDHLETLNPKSQEYLEKETKL